MSKIEELLKNEKVEWKKLGDICQEKFWIMPSTPKFSNDFKIPYITGKNIKNGEIDFDNVKYISEEDYLSFNKNRSINKDDILISMIGTIGEIGIVKEDNKFYGQNLYLLRLNTNIILTRYFYHYFTQNKVKNSLVSKKNSSSQGYIRAGNIENLEIPIPSIETQEKIVETLDNFTNYVTELQAELQARTKQYEYYRDMLLSEEYLDMLLTKPEFEGEGIYKTEWKALGEIGSFQNGTGMPKSLFVEDDGIGAIHYGHIYTKYNLLVDKPIVKVSEQKASNLKKVFPGDLVIAKTSENIEDVMKTVAYVGHDNAVTGGHAAIFRHNENSKYLSYVFNGASYLLRQKNKLARGVKVIELSITDMEKIKIPIPTVKIQEHIVSILDKFYTLLHNSSDGLQKEIELRQKQYEYYREKLLDFKK